MRRLTLAVREWVELRQRVREEFEFHRERAAADFALFGLKPRTAWQRANRRLGGRRFIREARREIGADFRGLMHLLIVHGVPARPLFQPLTLLLLAVVGLALSPSSKTTLESLLGTPLAAADRQSVFISRQAENLSFRGVTLADRTAIRARPEFTSMEPYKTIHLRARLRQGLDRSLVEASLQAVPGGKDLRLIPLFDRNPVIMAPAQAIWCLILIFGLWRMRDRLTTLRTATQVVLTGAAHALASLVLWAVAMQLWLAVPWRTDGRAALAFVLLFAAFSGVAYLQARWWIGDVLDRCPICSEKLRLAETTGGEYNTMIDPATTESFCIYGHGGLRQDRWNRGFRARRSYWESLTRA